MDGARTVRAPAIAELLRLIDEGYERRAWHGPNLRGAIRGLTARQAAWRPGPGRHSIWEIVVHCAYWKYAVRRRILGAKRGTFPRQGSNWPTQPHPGDDPAWRQDVALLADMHRQLRAAVAGLGPRELDTVPRGSRVSTRAIVAGVAMHDVYHAGQIQLLKRLARNREARPARTPSQTRSEEHD
jgi:uncharacterized damage-inducible protein DinB